ncbi:MAG: aldo/keto reductase [Oceanicaulis sp.]
MLTLPSKLGFGVSGAHGTPLVAPASTRALVEAAFEAGVRVFDTAPAYGNGEAERRLGAALRTLGRERVLLTTKAGLFSSGLARRRRDFSPDAIEASLRASLDRLGVAGVDVLFLHGAAPDELGAALVARLEALRRAGAFVHLGAAGRGGELDAAIERVEIAAVMAPMHPFLSAEERARLDRARAAGKAVFAIETAGDAPPGLRAPRRPGDLFALAKGVRARLGGVRGRGRVGVPDGLGAALHGGAHCALFTTTRHAHLRACLAAGQPCSE